MLTFDYYFLENKGWYTQGEDGFGFVLTDKAPIEAIRSYRKYLRDSKRLSDLELGIITPDESEKDEDKIDKYYEREIDNMSFAEIKEAIDRIRQNIIDKGCTEEEAIDNKMIAILGGMFIEDEINVKELNLLMGLVGKGYELPERFLKLSTSKQKDSFFDEF